MNNIKAAGQSSRLYPFATGVHKSMIRIMGKPLLEYTISGILKSGIKDIILVVNKNNTIKKYFGNGDKFGVRIRYVIQPSPLGMGNGLLLASNYIDSDFLLLHAYHVDAGKFVKDLLNTRTKNTKAVLLARERKDTENQGVLTVAKDRVIGVVEKPAKGDEQSNLCVVGIYLISKDFLTTLENTPFAHYQFENALSLFSKSNQVEFVQTKDETVTLKFPWDLLSIKNYLLKNIKKSIGKNVAIAKGAEILGNVVIENGATVMEGVRIKGPCFIGRNTMVGNNTLLRNGVCIEENCSVGAYMEMKNVLMMRGSKTHSGFVGDSVIGEGCRIGAQFCTGNVRLDRNEIFVFVRDKKVDSGLRSLGIMVGNDIHIGIRSSTMPGIIIGANSVIGPSTTVVSNVSENSKYYTKFEELVVKNEK